MNPQIALFWLNSPSLGITHHYRPSATQELKRDEASRAGSRGLPDARPCALSSVHQG